MPSLFRAPLSAAPSRGSRSSRAAPSHIAVKCNRHSNCLATAVLLLLGAVLLLNSPVVAAAKDPVSIHSNSFRCMRPFGAMDSFVAVAKADASQNCDFHYFTVIDATTELQCAVAEEAAPPTGNANAGAESAASSLSASACNVTVRWSMRRADDVVARLQRQVGRDSDYFTPVDPANAAASTSSQPRTVKNRPVSPFLTEDDDVWRYSVALRAKGDSTIHYKGFQNGDGYSLCCEALAEGECAWMAAQQGDNDLVADEEVNREFALQRSRMLRGCPLPFPTAAAADNNHDDDDDGGAFGAAPGGARVRLTDLEDSDVDVTGGAGVFHGVITKPLHRLVEGPWEVTVQMWRRRQRALPGSADGDTGAEAEVLGRVVVPFTLDVAELARQGRVRHVPSMALVVEDVAEVTPPVPQDEADNSDL